MEFFRTRIGTDFHKPAGLWERLLARFSSNPGYREKLHLVHTWLIEFDDSGNPWREIGLDAAGQVVVAGPSASNYGFWLDTNMQRQDFTGERVTAEYFEQMWASSGVVSP